MRLLYKDKVTNTKELNLGLYLKTIPYKNKYILINVWDRNILTELTEEESQNELYSLVQKKKKNQRKKITGNVGEN